jgi:hypothetical protein
MPVMEYVKFSPRLQRNVRLVWLKVVRHRQVGKEWLCKSFQSTPYELRRAEKKQEDLDHHGQDMAVQYVRFISVNGDLVGKSTFC